MRFLSKMTYVDGFVLVVKKTKIKDYEKMARLGSRIWKKHGALQYFECIGDDINPKMAGIKGNSFPKMTKLKKDETVWFSFIIFKSKAHRDAVNAKVMQDPQMSPAHWKNKPMPFDMKRMSYGGFKTIVEA